jgi:Tfp pilus assembly protein FimV
MTSRFLDFALGDHWWPFVRKMVKTIGGIGFLVLSAAANAPVSAQDSIAKADTTAPGATSSAGGDSASKRSEYSVNDIYEAVRLGRLDQARHMVEQVLKDHPRSGKAHFVAAEVYAKSGDFHAAKVELDLAEELQPGLPSINPKSVEELRRELARKVH